MPAFGVLPKTCFFLLPLVYIWFWCLSSQYDALTFSSWRAVVSDGSGIISIGKSIGVEGSNRNDIIVGESNGSGIFVEESNGSDIIVEESNGSSIMVVESTMSDTIVEESHGSGIIVEESNGSGVNDTSSSESVGVEESHGAAVNSSRKSMGVKELDVTSVISNKKSRGVEEAPLTPFQRIVEGDKRQELETFGVSWITGNITDICVVNRDVRIDTRKMVVHVASENLPPMLQSICPYTVKYNTCLPGVTPVEVVAAPDDTMPICDVNHPVPAIVFTNGGFATNLFHDFNDVIIPLFLTSQGFRAHIRFVVVDYKPMWVRKYRPILAHLSAYDPIYASKDIGVHCFPGAVVGLRYHSGFTCNASKIIGGYSMKDFRHFLFDAFNLNGKNRAENKKPVLVLISRTTTRRFLNQKQLVRLAKRQGFHVTVATPDIVSNLETFAQVLHSCDVLVGMHGAGMENLMFLHEGAVLVQVVPPGLEWCAKHYYGDPARALGIHYLKYEATYQQSSLSRIYSSDDQVIVDPPSIYQQSYQLARSIYLAQNVRIDLSRFRGTLLQAMQLIRTSAS